MFSPDYSIPSGKKKHFRINLLSCHFFSPLFTLRKLIYIPQNKETHHIYKISIPKISKHIFIPAKISTFRTAKMGCLSAPHFRYFPLFTGIFPLLLPKDMPPQETISCGIHTIFHCIYTTSRAIKATVSTCSSLSKLILMSSSMIGSLNLMDFNHCPLAWRSG